MIIQDLYDRFQTPKNLQLHMLRVGALGKVIIDNWNGDAVDTTAILQTCLFHDIAKPLTFDLSKQSQFGMLEADIKRLADWQAHTKRQYGEKEHEAAVAIFMEIGCTQESVSLIDDFEWKYLPRLLKEKKMEALISLYCDMRISPTGILSIQERMNELRTRRDDLGWMKDAPEAVPALESLLQKNVSIELDSISHESVEKLALELRDYQN